MRTHPVTVTFWEILPPNPDLYFKLNDALYKGKKPLNVDWCVGGGSVILFFWNYRGNNCSVDVLIIGKLDTQNVMIPMTPRI